MSKHDKNELPKTNRIQLIHALYHSQDILPSEASSEGLTLKEWCSIAEAAFPKIGFHKVYCHTSPKSTLQEHAEKNGESDKLAQAKYTCSVQWDIAKLNHGTEDKGSNTDPLFSPHTEHWVFYNNNKSNKRRKVIDLQELNKQYQRTKDR